jgi:hypothetical protein
MISSAGMAYCQQIETHTGEIKGILIEENTSRPVVGQTLILWGYNPKGPGSLLISISVAGQTPPKAKTDDAGKFSFTSLPGGMYMITPEVEATKTVTITFRRTEIVVKAGESLDLGVVHLRRGQ